MQTAITACKTIIMRTNTYSERVVQRFSNRGNNFLGVFEAAEFSLSGDETSTSSKFLSEKIKTPLKFVAKTLIKPTILNNYLLSSKKANYHWLGVNSLNKNYASLNNKEAFFRPEYFKGINRLSITHIYK